MSLDESVIQLRELSKEYPAGWRETKVVLKHISLSVKKGEVFGFLGPNGAGKTTTLKLMTGLIKPTSGEISILGRPPEDVEMRRKIGFLPENPQFQRHLTAREFMRYYGQLLFIPDEELKERSDGLLARLDLSDAADLAIGKFSKGMVQRLGIAQALLGEPEVLLLDEPMAGLDPLGRKTMMELMKEQKERGVTVFFSSHILSDVEVLCDRIGILHRGELVAVGTMEELMRSLPLDREKSLEEVFVEKVGEAQP